MESSWTHTTVPAAGSRRCPDPARTTAAGTYVDATFGRGGHARAILDRLGPEGRLIAFDKDAEAVAEAARIQDARFPSATRASGNWGICRRAAWPAC